MTTDWASANLATLPPGAIALRPFRVIAGTPREYTGFTFAHGLWGVINRLQRLGMIADDGSGILFDVMDDDGNIVGDFPVTRAGFKYCRRRWRFRWENRDDEQLEDTES